MRSTVVTSTITVVALPRKLCLPCFGRRNTLSVTLAFCCLKSWQDIDDRSATAEEIDGECPAGLKTVAYAFTAKTLVPGAHPVPGFSALDSGAAGDRGSRPAPATGEDAEPTNSDAIAAEGSSRALVFGIVATALFMSSLDATIVATALPAIDHDLHASINWAAWTITIYALCSVMVMPLAGKIADHFGRRRVFITGITIFTTTSLVCGFSQSIYMLVALRAIQAIGGGSFMPVTSGIVSDHFGKDRDRALGMFTTILPIGGVVGPVLGGVFVAFWTWRGIFLVNIPIGVVLLILAIRYIPESRKRSSERMDIKGVALLGGTILSAMFGITSLGNTHGHVLDPTFIGCEVLALCLALLFVRHTKRAARPFVPLRLLVSRGFGVMNLVNILYGTSAFGISSLIPLYAENRFHVRPLDASTILAARSVGMIALAGIAAVLMRRTGTRLPMLVGTFLMGFGLLLLAKSAPFGLSNYFWLTIGSTIGGIGMGIAAPATNNAQLQLEPTQVASITGLRGMFRQSGGIINISISTAIMARSMHPGLVQAHIFVVLAGILVVAMVLIRFFVPDHKGRW